MFKSLMLTASALAVVGLAAPVIAGDHSTHKDHKMEKAAQADIVGTAMSNPDFSTLVTAIKAAGLAEALQGEGPFTVFAPTNDAFAALPEGTLDDLLKPENKDQLAGILKYHVISGKVKAGDIAEGSSAVETLEGTELDVTKNASGVSVDEANVIKADIKTSNGVIHVIDKVVLPQG